MARTKRTRRPVIHRVLEKVVVDSDSCWLVEGVLLRKGYTTFTAEPGVQKRAHCASYEFFVGPMPEGYEIDHVCHNQDLSCAGGSRCKHRRCVNPKHLEAVPRQLNLSRGRGPDTRRRLAALQTHCKNGHEFSAENTYRNPPESIYNNRKCRTCQAEAQRRYRARQRAGLI